MSEKLAAVERGESLFDGSREASIVQQQFNRFPYDLFRSLAGLASQALDASLLIVGEMNFHALNVADLRDQRAALGEICGLLEGVGELQDGEIGVVAADDLQAHGQAFGREAGGDGSRGVAGG